MKIELVGGRLDGETVDIPASCDVYHVPVARSRVSGVKLYDELCYQLGTTRNHEGLPQFWLVPQTNVGA